MRHHIPRIYVGRSVCVLDVCIMHVSTYVCTYICYKMIRLPLMDVNCVSYLANYFVLGHDCYVDPLAAVWPAIGIVIVVILTIIVMLVVERKRIRDEAKMHPQ